MDRQEQAGTKAAVKRQAAGGFLGGSIPLSRERLSRSQQEFVFVWLEEEEVTCGFSPG
jgi:hypothetical protein